MINYVTRYAAYLLIASLVGLIATLYIMYRADRATEEAPFLHQRKSALTIAKTTRFIIGGLGIIAIELTAIWIIHQFRSPVATSASLAIPTRTQVLPDISTPTREPTITPTSTAFPPTPSATVEPTQANTSAPTLTAKPALQPYTVVEGDTLSQIAARFGTTIDAIQAVNPGINPNRIEISQELLIPSPSGTPTSTP